MIGMKVVNMFMHISRNKRVSQYMCVLGAHPENHRACEYSYTIISNPPRSQV